MDEWPRESRGLGRGVDGRDNDFPEERQFGIMGFVHEGVCEGLGRREGW